MVYPIFKLVLYPVIFLLTKRIKGIENIPTNKTFIIISNHEKLIDPLLILDPILKKLNKKIHFLAKPTWKFLGETICKKWAGSISLNDPKIAYDEMKSHLKHGHIVGIFPQGHITSKKRNPRVGAIRLALETNTPILPIGIKSSYFPFSATLNIGKLIHLKKDNKSIEMETADLMNHVYGLTKSMN